MRYHQRLAFGFAGALALTSSLIAVGCASGDPSGPVESKGTGGKADSGRGGSSGSGGSSAFECSYDTCPEGCCDGNTCVKTPKQSACGSRGAKCQACESDEKCVSGECTASDCDNCDGCCSNGSCVSGLSGTACGRGGAECTKCGTDETCSGGSCIASECGPDNCDGCCTANGECLTLKQQDTSSCGRYAESCKSCKSGATCAQGVCATADKKCEDYCTDGCCNSQGKCIPFTSQTNSACGTDGDSCRSCSGSLHCFVGECVQEGVFELQIISAKLPAKRPDGTEWDGVWPQDPLPDGYVSVRLATDEVYNTTSSTKDNTTTPIWNERLTTYTETQLLQTGLKFDFRESDGVGLTQVPFEFIDGCIVTFTPELLAANDNLVLAACGKTVKNVAFRMIRR